MSSALDLPAAAPASMSRPMFRSPSAAVACPAEPAEADWRSLAELLGEVLQSSGPQVALEVARAAVEAAPQDGNLQFLLGQTLAAAGRQVEALAALALALRLGTEVEVLDIAARIALPGPDYQQNLRGLHRLLRPARYLEIGVFRGDTLRLAEPGTQIVGIDPAPQPQAAREYPAPTVLHRLTSDAYFAAVAAGELPAPGPIGLAFIDGLHLSEQVLRDFINVERHCDHASVVVLHDTLPVAPQAASRLRTTSHWCGDVWKLVPCLRRYRPDLSLLTIPAYPSGLTIVTGLDPGSRVLADVFDHAVTEFHHATPTAGWLAAGSGGDVANDPALIRAWLAASPAGRRLAGS